MALQSLRTSARGGGSSGRWNGQRNVGGRSANVVQTAGGGKGETSNVIITHQQFEQLLKLIPGNAAVHGQTEEEFDTPFLGMITCGAAESKIQEWIVDSGASDHMTCFLNLLHNIRPAPPHMTIKLPTGSTTNITHIGDTVLSCGIPLFNVLFVPQFTHNLLSVTKLGKDNKCEVMFRDSKCFVTESESKAIVGVGYLKNNLYYLGNSSIHRTSEVSINNSSIQTSKSHPPIDKHTLWHNRLGHISDSKLKLIPSLKITTHTQPKNCLICPMSKFTKLP